MNLVFIFCEGPHDAQFVGRLLKESTQYDAYSKMLKEYPSPLKQFISNKFETRAVDEIRLGKSNYPLVPVCVYKKKDKNELILPMSLGGMDKTEIALGLLKEIENSFAEDVLENGFADDAFGNGDNSVEQIAVIFTYDADARGVQKTVDLFVDRFAYHFSALNGFSQELWVRPKNYPLSLFVFTNMEGDKGTLEDSLIELFKGNNLELITDAETFVKSKFKNVAAGGDVLAHEAKIKKGILTTSGQVEKNTAGFALTVVVRDTNLLNGAFDFDRPEAQWSRLLNLINGAFA